MKKVRIFLADDHQVLRDGLKALIDSQADMIVCGEADNGLDAVRLAAELRPDVIVMDISMPQLNGLQATRQVCQENPTIKVVVLTLHDRHDFLRQLLQAGAVGYVVKHSAAAVLLSAIRRVAEGGVYFDPNLMYLAVRSYVDEPKTEPTISKVRLSERETEVLRLLVQGCTAKEAAKSLEISVKTVETYKSRLMEKLKLTNRMDLMRYAHEHGLTSEL